MMRLILILLPMIVLSATIGCGPSQVNESSVEKFVRDYSLTWQAVETVMSRHFLIRHASEADGIIVSAPLRSDGIMASGHTIVEARIMKSPAGGYVVEVRATNYIDISEPAVLDTRTRAHDWVPVGFDKRLEARLLNEIDDARYKGRRAKHDEKFLSVPAPDAILFD